MTKIYNYKKEYFCVDHRSEMRKPIGNPWSRSTSVKTVVNLCIKINI